MSYANESDRVIPYSNRPVKKMAAELDRSLDFEILGFDLARAKNGKEKLVLIGKIIVKLFEFQKPQNSDH